MDNPTKIYFINKKTKRVFSEEIINIKKTPVAGTLKQKVEITFPVGVNVKLEDHDIYLDETEWLNDIKKL